MKTNKLNIFISFILLFALTNLSISPVVAQQKFDLEYVGSSTIGNFILEADKVYDDIDFRMNTEPESAGGELAIQEGRADLAGIANIPSNKTLRLGVVSTLIGWDAIAMITHESNAVKNLTITQLKGIFTGEITNWNELGGPNLEIHPYITGIESSTHKVCRSILLGETDYAGCETVRPDVDIITRVQNDPGAIGQISYSFIEDDSQINILSVNGQALKLTNASYPITRPLYLLWWSGRKEIAEFVQWTLSAAGQRIIMQDFIGAREGTINIDDQLGSLVVFTEIYTVEDGGTFYYPHRSYEVLNTDRSLVMNVPNHRSSNDENPTKIELPAGSYFIRPETSSGSKPEIFVFIESGKVTQVNAARDPDQNQSNAEDAGHDDASLNSIKKELQQLDVYKIIQPYGDMRIRAEEDISTPDNRFRGRFRVRAGIGATINQDVKLNLRVVSSNNPDDPNSPYANFTDGFNQVSIVIDRAYFFYHPQKMDNFSLWLGKFPNPFANSSVYSELTWDDDVHPEGLAFKFDFPSSKIFRQASFANGTYLLSQFKTGAEKNWLNSTQLSISSSLSDQVTIDLASSLYLFVNIKDENLANTVFDGNSGNATYLMTDENGDQTEHYVSDFHISDNALLFKINGLKMPLILKTQFFYNFGAEKNNTGYAGGLSYGALNEKGQFRTYYQYQHIQQDAVFSPFVQDDFNRQTNFNGHVFGFAYAFDKKISLHAWALFDEDILVDSQNFRRLRLDLNVKI